MQGTDVKPAAVTEFHADAEQAVVVQQPPVAANQRTGSEPYRDGRQTPIARDRTDAYDYALHAVAACCRRCVHYWHGIQTGRPLNDDEVAYLSELVRRYLRARLPDLPGEPTKIRPIRRQVEVQQVSSCLEPRPP